MSTLTTDDILDAIGSMTVMELVELKKAFEDRFDVTAAVGAPMMVAGPAAAGGDDGAADDEEEQTEFNVVLTAVGDKKIQVIKEVRGLTKLGLKEAKDLVEAAPKAVLEGVPKADADAAREALEAVGASIDIS